ncbi:MAG: nitroreductase family protein, partial [Duncaniella sp.]|nr:nitroreductase family protein [Duncaniella sp.]
MTSNAYPQLYRLAEQRYSCRSYSDRKVERDTILTILDVARLAPSACNRQPWMFLVADSPEQRAAILGSYDR